MAEGNRTTLVVAVAGIAATALVGLAGTAAAWLSARDDRAAQRELAREERTYDRRVSAYLDAIDFVEGQKESYQRWLDIGCSDLECPESGGPRIPYKREPPPRLISRLRAFGSAEVFEAFQETQKWSGAAVTVYVPPRRRVEFIVGPPYPYVCRPDRVCGPRPAFLRAYTGLTEAITRFENVVHNEVG